MNNKLLVKISNIIGIVSIILLVYWVFAFISVAAFELEAFKDYSVDIFLLILLAIFTLMLGSLLINIMLNLTRIAEKHNNDAVTASKKISKGLIIAFIMSFPLIFGLLYGGDYLKSKKQENQIIASAQSLVKTYSEKIDKIVDYSFSEEWIQNVANTLYILSETENDLSNMQVIVPDVIDDMPVFLDFGRYFRSTCSDTVSPIKKDYMRKTTKSERDYLNDVFFHKKEGIKYNKEKYSHEFYCPYFKNGKIIVLYFSYSKNMEIVTCD